MAHVLQHMLILDKLYKTKPHPTFFLFYFTWLYVTIGEKKTIATFMPTLNATE